ncbi:uncharacterized protein LOC142743511 isoform X2 [Rhinoderma darwinii]|uniref:uncharacterized protein LOC142743511 isoform X2 n=1 Tax=Rhinoderma darwinii TaxID=43563 RepID=UPI003F664928
MSSSSTEEQKAEDPAEVRRSEHWRLLRRSLGPALADPWLWLSGGPFTASSIGSMSRLSLGIVQFRKHIFIYPLCTEAGTFPEFFQQDGAPPHYGCQVRAFLDEQFPGKWIGRRGPVEWPPRSPDLTPLDFYLWGHLKAIVYAVKIRDVQQLKLRILEACASISSAVLLSVCEEWEKRVALTIQHNGQHFEHIL